MKKFKKVLILGLGIIIILGGFFLYKQARIKENREFLTSQVQESIINLEELATIKYNYTNIAEYKNNLEFSGINIPFTKKTFLVKYSGYLKAGVDDIKIDTSFIGDKNKVKVLMGKPKILDNVIMEEEVYFYNEKDSTFNRLKFDELYSILKEEKVKTEKEIVGKGFLNDAEENAKKIITNYLKTLGFSDVEISVE